MTRREAAHIRSVVEQAVKSLDDKTASTAAELFPRLKNDGALVKAGTRINWNGTVKQAAVDLWDTDQNSPDNAQSLWIDIAYRDGYRVIPVVITAADAFALSECGWWRDGLYRSKLSANIYTPDQYPDGWERVN